MNNIIHNISMCILISGIILLLIYITRINKLDNINIDNEIKYTSNKDIYNARVSNTFKKMFIAPAITQSYHAFDVNDKTDKLYIK